MRGYNTYIFGDLPHFYEYGINQIILDAQSREFLVAWTDGIP